MKTLWLLLIVAWLHATTAKAGKASSKSGNYAVLKGETVDMNCITPDFPAGNSNTKERKSVVWTDEEGKKVVNPRAEVLKTGDLKIKQAYESDSGVYYCKFMPVKETKIPKKIFKHKLIVYQLSGHKFVTTVTFDVTKLGSEATITYVRDLLKDRICASGLCIPGPVNSEKCEVTELEKQMCSMSMTYDGMELRSTASCNESCAKDKAITQLKTAQKLLEEALLTLSEDPKSSLKPEMYTFDTKHVITCKAGYHLIESNYEHCFPCLPGTFSESEILDCNLCPVGFYQEKYGSHNCEKCLGDLMTKTAGSKSNDDCRAAGDTGILGDIKEGIYALFKG